MDLIMLICLKKDFENPTTFGLYLIFQLYLYVNFLNFRLLLLSGCFTGPVLLMYST